jgi:hypothetical protein
MARVKIVTETTIIMDESEVEGYLDELHTAAEEATLGGAEWLHFVSPPTVITQETIGDND